MGKSLDECFPTAPTSSGQFDWDVRAFENFVQETKQRSRRLAVITSGGTAVSLEHNAVRYLDNFSTGSRGASCAENLLMGSDAYSVVFLSRHGSKLPFTRWLRDAADAMAPAFEVRPETDICEIRDERIALYMTKLRKIQEAKRLYLVQYTTVEDYLFSLRKIALLTTQSGCETMYVLAAAVSDFYVPNHLMPEHKTQSSDRTLTLQLFNVPKCLRLLTRDWAPHAFVVSFKLETDSSLLEEKCETALAKYEVDAVVANLLQTRYDVVHLVSIKDDGNKAASSMTIHRSGEEGVERRLMEELIDMHDTHITKQVKV